MVAYNFQCASCKHDQLEVFSIADYDDFVNEDGSLVKGKCENCGHDRLLRHITKAPSTLGGTKGYMSMERWQEKNPDNAKRKEEELSNKLQERHRKKVMDKIDKQKRGNGDGTGIERPK